MKNSRPGFTLIELIIVMIIIGILSSLAAPIMSGLKNKAILSEAVAAMGTIRTLARMYYVEHNVYPSWQKQFTSANSAQLQEMNIRLEDFKGTYFSAENYYYMGPSAGDPGGFSIVCSVFDVDLGGVMSKAGKGSDTLKVVNPGAANATLSMTVDGKFYQYNISASGFKDSGGWSPPG